MNHFDVPWGLLALVVGIGYGYFARGTTDKWGLFKKALLWGLVLAVILAVVGFFLGGVIGFGVFALGAVGILIAVVVLTLLFLLGAWIGDWLEGRFRGDERPERA